LRRFTTELLLFRTLDSHFTWVQFS
jgi:hypothetical protein